MSRLLMVILVTGLTGCSSESFGQFVAKSAQVTADGLKMYASRDPNVYNQQQGYPPQAAQPAQPVQPVQRVKMTDAVCLSDCQRAHPSYSGQYCMNQCSY